MFPQGNKMTEYFLKHITVEGFRGINNEGDPLCLNFDNECVNSIFAPNGSGKSSVFEALFYAMRGKVPRLDELPSSDQSADYYCNRFHSADATITLKFVAEPPRTEEVEIEVKRSKSGTRTVSSPTGHPNPEEFLQLLENSSSFLDYRTFSRFVEDSPLKRGRSFSALLGLAKISDLRQALSTLSNAGNIRRDFEIDSLETKFREDQRSTRTADQRIRSEYIKLTGKELIGKVIPQLILNDAKDILGTEKLLKPLLDEQLDRSDFQRLRSVIRDAENSKDREELAELLSSLSTLENLAPKASECDEQETLFQLLEEFENLLQKTNGALLQKLLKDAENVIETASWDPFHCPVCDSTTTEPLHKHIQSKLQSYEDVDNCNEKIKENWQSALWVSRLRSLDNVMHKEEERVFNEFDQIFSNGQPTQSDNKNALNLLNSLEKKRNSTVVELKSRKDIIEDSLPPSLVQLMERVEASEQLVSAIDEYIRQSAELKKTQNKLQQRQRWQDFINRAYSIFSNAEVKLSTEKTLEIEGEYREMYKAITANSEIVPKLEKTPGSEELRLRLEKFYNLTDLSATTLLSESYRNALAISLYLSAALRSKTNARFMILDDVTSSFDAGHQFALMELIRTTVSRSVSNPGGMQVILLSHDGLLEKYFDRISQEADWKHQSLQGKSPQGKVFTQAQEAERLKQEAKNFLDNGQINQAEPLVRQYLEYRLLSLIKKLEIPVPIDFAIRGDRKMVQNSINAIKNAVDLHEQASQLILEPQQIADFKGKIIAPAVIANLLAHYDSAVASSFNKDALASVLDEVDNLADCFKYDCQCQSPNRVIRRYYKNLTKKECAC